MPAYVLRLEGVDFDATIGETHNLSAFRGGSLALLAAPIAVGGALKETKVLKEKIFAGASLGAWIIEAKDDAAADKLRCDVREFLRGNLAVFASGQAAASRALAPMASAEAAWPHLSFVVDVAAVNAAQGVQPEVEPEFLALKQAEANNHARQFREANWALPNFNDRARGSHPRFDRVRPALPDCKVSAQDLVDQPVSPSFKARFEYGRDQRQNFYKLMASPGKAETLDFAESFEDIVEEAPKGLPKSICGKIAVFYADGNKFNRIREQARTVGAVKEFSERLLCYQKERLLDGLLDWLRAGGGSQDWEAYLQYPRSKGKGGPFWPLRFETLMWGGDELTFVMPAWLGIEFAQKFFDEWTQSWTAPSGEPLTFGAGLLFCHEKTPIRQARKMARILAEDAKKTLNGALEHVLQIEAFESIALPEWEHGLERYRRKTFEADPDPSWLTLRGNEISKTFHRVRHLKEDFPRSQLYWLLRLARDKKLFPDTAWSDSDRQAAGKSLEDEARAYFRRKGRNPEEELPKLCILEGAPLAFSLAAGAALWDYVDPLALMEDASTAEAAQ